MKKSFILLIALFSCGFLSAQEGEILYREFAPPLHKHFFVDYLVTGSGANSNEKYLLDLDQDGTKEWCFHEYGGYHGMIGIYLVFEPSGNHWTDWPNYKARSFQIGDTIANHVWAQYSQPEVEMHFDGFYDIGIRAQVEGGYCYGWIEVSLVCDMLNFGNSGDPAFIDLYVHRLAYCTVPNYPLRVGQTNFNGNSVDANEEVAFANVYPSPNRGQFFITGDGLKQAEVFTPLGQLLASIPISGEQTSFDLSAQPAGIYLVSITDKEGKRCVKKVIRQ